MPSAPLSDRLLAGLKNNRVVAVVVVVATIVGAVAQFTDAFDKVRAWLGLDGHAQAIYRPLVANLENLDRSLQGLAALNTSPIRDRSIVLVQVHMVEVAAEPVCDARTGVSQLGNAETRRGLDAICATVESLRPLAENTVDGAGATALAVAIEHLGTVKRVHDALVPRT